MAFPGTAKTAAIGCISNGSRSAILRRQLPEIFSRFYSSLQHRTCSVCGTVMQAPGLTDAGAQCRARSAQDAADPLAGFAQEFHHPYDAQGRKLLYFGGHSLGLQPKSARRVRGARARGLAAVRRARPHDAERPWIPYHERAARGARRLGGRRESEVVAMNSLTVNLHLMMVSFFRPDAARNRVLIESSAFPSDRYAVVSQLEFHGLTPREHLIEVAAAGRRANFANRGFDRAHRAGGTAAWRWCCCPACNISPANPWTSRR